MNFTKGFCFEKKNYKKSQDFEEKNLEFPKILMMGQSKTFARNLQQSLVGSQKKYKGIYKYAYFHIWSIAKFG
jgi:hypothetical protein